MCVSCRLAEEELLRESERARERSEVIGIEGFKKCPVPRANKRFLINTIVNNIKSNNINKSRQLKRRKHSQNAPSAKRDKKVVNEKTDLKDIIPKNEGSSKK